MARLAFALLVVALASLPAAAVSVQITRTDDPLFGGNQCTGGTLDCSLRGAITAVENDATLDRTIHVPAGFYPLSRGVLLLMNGVKLVGSGASSTIVDALGLDRVVGVVFDNASEISGMTLSHGKTTSGNGAGILNLGTLTLTDCVVRDNVSQGVGGGISNHFDPSGQEGVLTLVRTAVLNNKAAAGGGGIFNDKGTLTATDCTLDGNEAFILSGGGGSAGLGGGIRNDGQATCTRCTISRNGAGAGGGVSGFGAGSVLTLADSTLSGNFANVGSSAPGGAITVSQNGAVILKNVTVTGNSAKVAGGIEVLQGAVSIVNSIIAGNHLTTGPASDCKGTLSSLGFNLIGTMTDCMISGGSGDQSGVDPLLGSLGSNGGLTETHALMPGSPAIDAANPAAPGSGGIACSPSDQRGVERPQGGRCDIGAYEVAVPTTTTTTTTLPPVERCDDCVDNDGDGLTDLEEPACCAEAARLELRASRLTPRKGRATLDLGGTLVGATLPEGTRADDVVVQLRAEGLPDFLCARIPAAGLARRGRKASFNGRKQALASGGGVDTLGLAQKKGGLALHVRGTKLALPLPPAGTLHVTVGLHDPSASAASSRCSAAAATLQATRKGVLRFR